MRFITGRLRALTALAIMLPASLPADQGVTIAVASNFHRTASEISTAFTGATGVPVRISPGSTGKLYAQIVHGAPYDLFLAADSRRPRLLEQSGLAVTGSRNTYATGSLVLWSQDEALLGQNCLKALERGEYGRLALANPEIAPYGAAARDVLVNKGLWESVSMRAVYGENIAQTLQFVASGNATIGFIAASQLTNTALPASSCSWPVPAAAHRPLDQQLVMLRRAEGNADAHRLIDFIASAAAREIIRRHGYRVSD